MRHPMHSTWLFIDMKALRPRTVGLWDMGIQSHAPFLPGLVPYDVWPVYPTLSSILGFSSGGRLCVSSEVSSHICVLTASQVEVLAGAPALHARQRLARGRSMMLRAPREPCAWGVVRQSDSLRNMAEPQP